MQAVSAQEGSVSVRPLLVSLVCSQPSADSRVCSFTIPHGGACLQSLSLWPKMSQVDTGLASAFLGVVARSCSVA